MDEPTVSRSVVLDAGVDEVLAALERPDVLSAWLGEWTADGAAETVRTDDGVLRSVERLAPTAPGEVRWAWSPVGDPGARTDVRFLVVEEAVGTRLTVVETATASTRHGAPMSTAPATPWLRCLMALGAVLAVGSPVTV